jgi:hypothetical protein
VNGTPKFYDFFYQSYLAPQKIINLSMQEGTLGLKSCAIAKTI